MSSSDVPPRRSIRVRRSYRRWPRRTLLVLNLAVAVLLVCAGAVYGYARYRLDAIHTVAAGDLSGEGPATADGLSPENILLIGNETRAGLTNPQQIAQFGSPQVYSGSLSDVIMILHLDPRTRSASILSIPRDLFVPMPAGSPVGAYNKVDAALNDGAHGPANLIAAISQDFGIPINHYVEVNFDGFENTVNALGGIRIDFPERLFDASSLLSITHTGCQQLSGAQALALVRSRHLQYDPPGVAPGDPAAWPHDPESDLARIVRDHTFLRVLIDTARSQGLTNPIKANAFLGAITDQVTMDPGLRDQLLTLAAHYSNIAGGSLPETTIPVTVVPSYSYGGYAEGDVDFPVEPADDRVIAAWDRQALPAPQRPAAVAVYNAVGSADLAGQTGQALTSDGLPVTAVGDAPVEGDPSETLVRYHPGQVASAMAVLSRFSGAVMLQSDATVPAGTVRVDVGTTESVAGAGAAPTSASTSAPTATAPTTTVPTAGGAAPSASADQLTPWDPRPC